MIKFFKTSIFILILLNLTTNQLSAQHRTCHTLQMDSLRRLNNPAIGNLEDFEHWMQVTKATRSARSSQNENYTIYRIPVIVHVVHNGESVGIGANISFEQVAAQIEVLNEDFRRISGTNGYNDHISGVDTQIEFYLAAKAPDGSLLPEPGVDRINGGKDKWSTGILTNPIENELKPVTIWDPERYFNIWTVNFGGFLSRNTLGYAQFPDMSGLDGLNDIEGSSSTDGVVIGYKYFGSSEKGNFPDLYAPFDLGRTTTHEVGHWLGLRHIWGDGDCSADDFCNDTPTAASANYGCPTEHISCGTVDMIENYMDYTDDICMNVFTKDQRERMLTVLGNSPRRKNLVEKINIITDINEQPNANKVFVFPNPSEGVFNLHWNETPVSYSVLTMQGQEILNVAGSLAIQSTSLDLSAWRKKNDLFLLKIITRDGNTIVKKLIMN